MSTLKTCLIAASLCTAALAGAASARPQLSDSQFLAAARCQTLMSSSTLGKVDSASIDAVLKSQASSRSPAVSDLADEARSDAKRAISHAGPSARAALIAERDGPCAATAQVAVTAGGGSAGR